MRKHIEIALVSALSIGIMCSGCSFIPSKTEISTEVSGEISEDKTEFKAPPVLYMPNCESRFDIDNDGVVEDVYIGYGNTSGIASFSIVATVDGKVKYLDYFYLMSSVYELSLSKHGKKSIKFDDVVLDLYVADGHIEIEESDKIHLSRQCGK